jgi:hypothetical protein
VRHTRLMRKIRLDFLQMIANSPEHWYLTINDPQCVCTHVQPHAMGSHASYLNILWARMTYITDELTLVCPVLGVEKGLRNIMIEFMEQPHVLVGGFRESVFVSRMQIHQAERNIPAIYK